MHKILLIEDDEKQVETLRDTLYFENYDVLSETSGLDGIQNALKNLPDLIICDIHMPGINGHEVYRALSQAPSTACIPFIFLTAMTSKEDIRAGMNMGADDYITKPYQTNDILGAIRIKLKKFDDRLWEIRQQLQMQIDTSPLPICCVNKELAIQNVNTAFCKHLDFNESELIGNSFLEFIDEKEKEDLSNKFHLALSGINNLTPNFKLKNKNGKIKYAESALNLYNIHRHEFVLLNISNYSSLKKDENQVENAHLYSAIGILKNNSDLISSKLINELNSLIKKHTLIGKPESKKFTCRELEVINLACKGFGPEETAEKMNISLSTVRSYNGKLIVKTHSKNMTGVILYALRNGYYDMSCDKIL